MELSQNLSQKGYLTVVELKTQHQYPTEERFKKGPVAIIECVQEIPCNPCEAACTFGAITVGEPITNNPVLEEEKCTGCRVCVAKCPGLAIFVVDKTYSETHGTVTFPYEYLQQPAEGEEVLALDRQGKVRGEGTVVSVRNPKSFDHTPLVTVAVPLSVVEEVRSIRRNKA